MEDDDPESAQLKRSGPHLRIRLFGEFSLDYEGQDAPVFSGDRPISLLAYLLLKRHTAVSRQTLAFTLWPDSSESQARTNLRNLFYTLRQTLPQADNYLAADSMTLQWRSNANYTLDIAEFEFALAQATTAVSEADKIHYLETAVALYKGEVLPNNYDDWIIPIREELHQAYLDGLHQLMGLLEQAGDYRAATRTGQRLVQLDPLDESIYIKLMRLHALNGDRAGVIRTYEACAAVLGRELDIEPGQATRDAYEELLKLQAPVVLPATLPLPVEIRPLSLPVHATPFIGREMELARIAECLADPTCRLLTIVGPGGIGKTRLALHSADGHRPVFNDGVAWVALNAVESPKYLAPAIAESLNFRLRGTADTEKELLYLLRDKELLLVLDNLEHLLPGIGFLSRLVAETTAVKLLVTSRQATELPEEWRFDLGGFTIPEEGLPETANPNDAMQLFINTARRTAGAIMLTENDNPAIARICRLVGGMPLGIELAASWVRLLSCTEIAKEIEKTLDFLTVSLRHLPARHRSLRAVFDYSWKLIDPEEQKILLRLAIFQGVFSRESAKEVAQADLAMLSTLVNHALIQRTAVGQYSLHNIIRQFAAEKLQADPARHQEITNRHGRYYLNWLAEQTVRLQGPEQRESLNAIAVDLPNIRAAWSWSLTHHQYDRLKSAAFPLFYFYELRGLLNEGETIFRETNKALQQIDGTGNEALDKALCEIQTHQAFLSFRLGRIANAEALLGQIMVQPHRLTGDSLLSHSSRHLALIRWSMGQFSDAIDLMSRSLAFAERVKDPWLKGMAQSYLGMIMFDQGQLDKARDHLTPVAVNIKEIGDPRLMANTLLIFGRTNLFLGYLADAENQLTACLEITKDPNSLTYATLYLGMVKQAQGDLATAREQIEKSISLFTSFNDLVGRERASVPLGFLEIAATNYKAAEELFLDFLQAKERVHSIRYILSAVVGMAVLRTKSHDDPLTALVWTLAVLNHPGVDWEAQHRAEMLREELLEKISPDQLALAEQQASQRPFADLLVEVCQPPSTTK